MSLKETKEISPSSKPNLSLVSVIIPVYNGSLYLEELLSSLEKQTYQNFEIIAIDNKSSDDSTIILNSFKSKNIPIKIILNEKNDGYCKASNQGVKNSNGSYILFLSQDRIFEPDWLEKTVAKMESDVKIGCVVGKIMSIDKTYIEYGISYDIYGASLVKRTPEKNNLFYQGGAILVRKDLLDKIGVFDPEFFMYQEDVDLCWKIRLVGYNISLIEDALSYDNGRIINSNIEAGKLNINFDDPNFKNMPFYIFYNSFAKNRIRIMIKNYSLINVVKRLPVVITLIFLRGLFLTLTTKKLTYVLSFFQGLWWNIIHIKNTLDYRKKIQKIRIVDDSQIERYMIRRSLELSSIGIMIRWLIKKDA